MDRKEIEKILEAMAKCQGTYGRVLESIRERTEEGQERVWSILEAQNFVDPVDVVLFIEGHRMSIDRGLSIFEERAWSGLYDTEEGGFVACWIYGGDPDPDDMYPDCAGGVYIVVWDTYDQWRNGECEEDGSLLIFYEDAVFGDVVDWVKDVHGLTMTKRLHDCTDPEGLE